MELRYPFVIAIVAVVVGGFLTLVWLWRKKRKGFVGGTKIANTQYVKETEYYKARIKKYNMYKYLLLGFGIVAITAAAVLIARPARVENTELTQYSRDIILCMDVSASVDELNKELVESLEQMVDQLQGERFGITIFNTSAVALVPLTDDYEYVKDTLEEIKKSIMANNSVEYGTYEGDDYFYAMNYITSGTVEGADERGSSLIGDGLASCAYSFPDNGDERTKIIILSTDNDLAGEPLVSLSEAARISEERGVKVFGIGTKLMKSGDRQGFKSAIEENGGKFYEHSNESAAAIVEDIEATSKSLLKNQRETKKVDQPQAAFVVLVVAMIGMAMVMRGMKR